MGTLPLGRAKIKMAGGGGEVPAGLRLPEDQQRRGLKIAGRIMRVSPQDRKPKMLAQHRNCSTADARALRLRIATAWAPAVDPANTDATRNESNSRGRVQSVIKVFTRRWKTGWSTYTLRSQRLKDAETIPAKAD